MEASEGVVVPQTVEGIRMIRWIYPGDTAFRYGTNQVKQVVRVRRYGIHLR